MNPVLSQAAAAPVQWMFVAVLVVVCALYSTWRVLSVKHRLWLVEWLLPAAQRAKLKWPGKLRASLRRQALKACGGGCCGSDGPPPAGTPPGARPSGAARTRSAGAPRR